MSKSEGPSRNARRMNTKASTRRQCQNMTRGVVQRSARPVRVRKSARLVIHIPDVEMREHYIVSNTKTKKTMDVEAFSIEDAIDEAMMKGLARKRDNIAASIKEY